MANSGQIFPIMGLGIANPLPTEDVSDGIPGQGVPSTALQVAGSDGTNLQAVATDSNGQVKVLVENTPTVAVTGTSTVEVAGIAGGTVALAGTSTVEVAGIVGTSTVTVAGSVSLSGTNTVEVAGIAGGTVSVAGISAGTVAVAGTSTVEVAGIAGGTVAIAGTSTVEVAGIVGTSTVTIAGTVGLLGTNTVTVAGIAAGTVAIAGTSTVSVSGTATTMSSDSTKATYRCVFSIAAVAGDSVVIQGSSTKTVKIREIWLTSETAQTRVILVKRSAADTGGTSTSGTLVSLDSSDSGATAVVKLYTVAPSLGSAVGNILNQVVGQGSTVNDEFGENNSHKPVVLNGTSEYLAVNISANTTLTGYIEFTEE